MGHSGRYDNRENVSRYQTNNSFITQSSIFVAVQFLQVIFQLADIPAPYGVEPSKDVVDIQNLGNLSSQFLQLLKILCKFSDQMTYLEMFSKL